MSVPARALLGGRSVGAVVFGGTRVDRWPLIPDIGPYLVPVMDTDAAQRATLGLLPEGQPGLATYERAARPARRAGVDVERALAALHEDPLVTRFAFA